MLCVVMLCGCLTWMYESDIWQQDQMNRRGPKEVTSTLCLQNELSTWIFLLNLCRNTSQEQTWQMILRDTVLTLFVMRYLEDKHQIFPQFRSEKNLFQYEIHLGQYRFEMRHVDCGYYCSFFRKSRSDQHWQQWSWFTCYLSSVTTAERSTSQTKGSENSIWVWHSSTIRMEKLNDQINSTVKPLL